MKTLNYSKNVFHLIFVFAFCLNSIVYSNSNYIVVRPSWCPTDLENIKQAIEDIEPHGTIHLEPGVFDLFCGSEYPKIIINKSCTIEGTKNLVGESETTIVNLLAFEITDGDVIIRDLKYDNNLWPVTYSINNKMVGKISLINNVHKAYSYVDFCYSTIEELKFINSDLNEISLMKNSCGDITIANNYITGMRVTGNSGGDITIANNHIEFYDDGIWCQENTAEKIHIINNNLYQIPHWPHYNVGINSSDNKCPIDIIANVIDINQDDDLLYSSAIAVVNSNYKTFENPPVRISKNLINLAGGWTAGIRVGHSGAPIFNCLVDSNKIKSYPGKFAFEGIGVWPNGENNHVIGNDLSELSTWGFQAAMMGRYSKLEGNTFGFANGERGNNAYSYSSPSTAVQLISVWPFYNPDGQPPDPTEYNEILNNDYRNCGLPGWDYDADGNLVGGCIFVQSIPAEIDENNVGSGPPNEVRFNLVHETGRFPVGTGGPKQQILVIKSNDEFGNPLVHDNRIIGLSADELVLYKNANKNKSTIIDQSFAFVHKESYADQSDLLQLYPNPSDDIINIEIENSDNATIEIYNVSGRLIFNKELDSKVEKIDVSDFTKGIYIVKVVQDSAINVSKFVVR